MREKEDTIRNRVNVSDKELREALDKLLGKDKDRNGSSAAMGESFVLDPFDRAVFRAILEVEEEFGLGPPPASTVRPKGTTKR
jgi:fumarylacetoacetate (FAA) hydrolase family protein